MAKKLLVFPFGGNARELVASITSLEHLRREWDVIGFIDDDKRNLGRECCGVKVVGARHLLKKFSNARFIAVPGSPENYLRRKYIIDGLGVKASRFARFIHPSAAVSVDAQIGGNTLIMSNVVVGCGVRVGDHCVILPNTVIGHDTIIGDYCCIGSNAAVSGNVTIGDECYIASGSSIKDNISIGRQTLIGIGSNVISDIGERVIAAGNPAKILRKAKL